MAAAAIRKKSCAKRRRAKKSGATKEETRSTLQSPVPADLSFGGLGSEIAAAFENAGWEEEITELRGYGVKAADFD